VSDTLSSRETPPHALDAVVEPARLPRRMWLVTLVVGALMWIAVAAAVAATNDTILVPTLILLGTFLVPISTVLFVLAQPRRAYLSVETIMVGFIAGGTTALVLAGTAETYILPHALATNGLVGLIEEGGKALLLVAVASLVRPRVPRDGMVLGATVGAGFAAFESAGYALSALIEHGDKHATLDIVQTEAFRAVLAPFGHITWTAILGGAIFASAWHSGRFRLDRRVAATYLGVAFLHACWDSSYGVAIRVSMGLGGQGWRFGWPDTAAWVGSPTGADLVRWQIVYNVLLAILATIGSIWAVRRWRAYQFDRWRARYGGPAWLTASPSTAQSAPPSAPRSRWGTSGARPTDGAM
jgi:RsiW-degrading membrane proteinase PrsW (M82 family)